MAGIIAVGPGALLGWVFLGMTYVSCYVMAEVFSYRTPEMASFQMKLLEKYRQDGVINEETYQRAVSAVHRDKHDPEDKTENRQR